MRKMEKMRKRKKNNFVKIFQKLQKILLFVVHTTVGFA